MGDSDDPTEADEQTEALATKREGQHTKRHPGKGHREGALERGTLIGRYVVLELLGEGGMGVVYAAYDPELDRKVAIKLLQAKPTTDSSGGQAWLMREAQALARLSHPNVIAVHDVGSLPGDRVFVAMELVDGQTLRGWSKGQPRSWRDVQRVMLAAGAGLAAAHAVGLVHRDFKPENVLVGKDGRVRVLDFGLARLHADESTEASRNSDLNIDVRSPLSESLTVEGSVVGTPAYMAPELQAGRGASARTDQFAFGVTLYELLYRTRPFDKKELVQADVATIKPKDPPPANGVPTKIQRVAMRAIAVPSEQRYASMDELLAELAVDPTAGRRRGMIAAGTVLAIGGLFGGVVMLSSSRRDELCKGADRRLAGVWDGATKKAVRDTFSASKRPFATQTFAGLDRALDAYAAEWSAAVTESCEATRIRGEQTEEVLTLRQDCLDQRLHELRAFTQLVSKADDAMVEKAGTAALGLEPVSRCANVAALKAPTQPTPEIRPQLEPVYDKLADAKAGILTGNIGRAINAGTEAADLAHKIPFEPLEAEAQLVLGSALLQVGNSQDAAIALAAATWTGLRSRRDDVAALAALHAALTISEGLMKDGEAKIWLDLGKAISGRFGSTGESELRVKMLETEGIIAGNRGDLITATAAHEKALDLALQVYGADGTLVARSHQTLAATLARAGDFARALPHYERARVLVEAYLGPDHPDVALMLSGLGTCYHYTGETKKSYAAFERSIVIREKVFGSESPVLIPTLNNFATLLRDDGAYEKALPMIERAKKITEGTVGRGHPYFVVVETTRGDILLGTGRTEDARAAYDKALEIALKVTSPYLPETQMARAKLAADEKQWELATSLAEAAIAGMEKKAGVDAPELYKPLTTLAVAKIGTRKPDEARPLLERAIAIGAKAKLLPKQLAPTRTALASITAVVK